MTNMSVIRTFIKLILGRGVYRSYSISGEDLIILPFLIAGQGFYIDVGCYHPILYSNTYRLYRNGWHGIVVDPNRRLRRLFNLFRPRDFFIENAVGTSGGEHTYYRFEDESYNTLDKASAEKYKLKTRLLDSYTVEMNPLSEILKGVERIDLLNIDAEGMDLEVLQSYDWHVRPSIIIVEGAQNSPSAKFLGEKGYILIGLTRLNSIFQLSNHTK